MLLDHTAIETISPGKVPLIHVLIWSQAANAAEAALDFPLNLIISAPLY